MMLSIRLKVKNPQKAMGFSEKGLMLIGRLAQRKLTPTTKKNPARAKIILNPVPASRKQETNYFLAKSKSTFVATTFSA